MAEIILLSVLIIAISWFFIAIKVWLKPKGRMTSQHIHDSPAMRKLGIHCVMDQDREDRQRQSRMNKKLRTRKQK